MKEKIGTVSLTTRQTFLDNGYECAAWWQKVACEPQTVDLWVEDSIGTPCLAYGFKGAICDADFTSHFGGNSFGKYDKSRDVGREASYSFHPYAYQVLSRAFNGQGHWINGIEFSIDPELVAIVTHEMDHAKYSKTPNVPDIKTHRAFVPRAMLAERLEKWAAVPEYLNVREEIIPECLLGSALTV